MSAKYFFTSLTRISNLPEASFSVEPLPREKWGTGDYVVGQISSPPKGLDQIELRNGRMAAVAEGDLIVGTFGKRPTTLEDVGDWRDIGEDLRMEALTAGGVFGKVTSSSPLLPPLLSLTYKGHVFVDGASVGMRDFAPPTQARRFDLPVVLVIGTSMSSGKTTSAKLIVRLLREAGLKVIGSKLSGSGRYRDILAMEDAGAEHIFDFVDAGLPSTVVPEEEYRRALRNLLAHMAAMDADVLVAEAGGSPLEPYNGATAIEELAPHVRCTVLCASDAYGVVGLTAALGTRPDLVTGLATSTEAGIEFVEKLSGIKALNVLDKGSFSELRAILKDRLALRSE